MIITLARSSDFVVCLGLPYTSPQNAWGLCSCVNTKPMVHLVHQNYSGYLTKQHQDKHDNGAKKAIHSKFTKDRHRVVAAKLEILEKV